MQNEKLARRYATAIFNLSSGAGTIDLVGANLHSLVSAIYGNDDVRRFYLSPVFERAKKLDALSNAFVGKVDDIALHALLLLVKKRRESLLPTIAEQYAKLALAASGKAPLEIVSARELPPADLASIVARLTARYGTAFDVTSKTDPNLLGGMRITMGDRRIDGTLAGRFDALARDLQTNVN